MRPQPDCSNSPMLRCSPAAVGLFSLVLATWPAAIPNAVAGSGAYFQPLGDLPGGSFQSSARAISADGSVVVGNSRTSEYWKAFRWTATEGMVEVADLPGQPPLEQTGANDVSADGSVIVGTARYPGQLEFAVYWTAESGYVSLNATGPWSRARGVSGDGSIVVGVAGGDQFFAFRWTQATGMMPLMGSFSDAEAVSDGGAVVGSSSEWVNSEAYYWSYPTGVIWLGDLGGFGDPFSHAHNITPDGTVVVGGANNAQEDDEFFRWTAKDGMVGLGPYPNAMFCNAFGVSDDGQIIVGRCYTVADVAVIWDQVNGVRSLKSELQNDFGIDMTGWVLYSAEDVSGDGSMIVGWGRNPQNQQEAWLAHVPRVIFQEQPQPQSAEPDEAVQLTVAASSVGTIEYQWRKDGINLVDGGNISGSTTPELNIEPVSKADAGTYDVVLTTGSYSAASDPAALTVGSACSADIAGNDGTVNIDDLFALITAWGPCPGCAEDIDDDGDVDIDDLFTVIAMWGPCQ